MPAVAVLVAALVGAAVGGYASYWANRSLKEDQAHDAARGAARVYQIEFGNESARFSAELDNNRLIPPSGDSPIQISLEDKKLIASQLSAEDWFHVADAESALNVYQRQEADSMMFKLAAAGKTVPLRPPIRRLERLHLKLSNSAIQALAPLAGNASDVSGPPARPTKGTPVDPTAP